MPAPASVCVLSATSRHGNLQKQLAQEFALAASGHLASALTLFWTPRVMNSPCGSVDLELTGSCGFGLTSKYPPRPKRPGIAA